MKSFFLFLSICLFETGFSQKNLDFGEVNGKNIQGCNDSPNNKVSQQFNIFFIDEMGLTGRSRSVSLSYNGAVWSPKMYENDLIHDKVDSFALIPIFSFDSVFSALKANKIFLLPDQKLLKNVKGSVDDGHEYTLSFRAGCKLRSYEFNNPEFYMQYNKDIPEFVNYTNIIEILFNWFKKE